MPSGWLTSQFVTEEDWVSGLIRYGTNSKVSHVDLVLPNGYLLGARSDGGVKVRPPNYARFTYVRRLRVLVPDVAAAYDFANQQVGKPYNYLAIVHMLLHVRRKLPPNPKRWFCDELNYAIVWAGGIQLLNTDDPLTLSPEEEMLSPLWQPVPII